MENLKNLMGALLKAKSAMGALTKDSENPHFKSSYASLAAVVDVLRKPLADSGIVYIESPVPELDPGRIAIDLMLYHPPSGESVTYRSPVMVAQQMTPQGIGSTLTYARRYHLMTVFGLAPEDDDGNEGTKPATKPAAKPAQHRQPTPPATNGHKAEAVTPVTDGVAAWAEKPEAVLFDVGYSFSSAAEAQGWGMAMGVFKDNKHCVNAYNKVKADAKPETAQAMWDAWIEDVARRVNEAEGEEVPA